MHLSPKSRGSYFSPKFFKFLRDLARNNNREWFQKNKPRYERFVFIPSLIRFSKDKSPYKTNVAMEFWHQQGGKKSYTGLYLHLASGDSFAGAGLWHPDPPTLNRVRKAIVSRPEAWRQVKESGLKMEGESLKRPPAGFDRNHPFAEDLKLKDITAGVLFSNAQVTGPRFMKDFVQASRKLDPLNKFLAGALSLPW